jgi:hypothetical protein
MTEPKDPQSTKIACGTCKKPLGNVVGNTIITWVAQGQRLAFTHHTKTDLRVWCRKCRRHGLINVENTIVLAEKRPKHRRNSPMPIHLRWLST